MPSAKIRTALKQAVKDIYVGKAPFLEVGEAINQFHNNYVAPLSSIPESLYMDKGTGMPNADIAAPIAAMPAIFDLLKRLKTGDKSAAAAIKTIGKFAREKVAKDPYWEAGELVPTKTATELAEINRSVYPKYPGRLEEVGDYVLEHGIDDMGIMSYNPKNAIAHLSEGNHRAALAKKLDIPFVPLRGYRSSRAPYNASGGLKVPRPFEGRVPAEFKPSQVGFDVYDTEELIDFFLKIQRNK